MRPKAQPRRGREGIAQIAAAQHGVIARRQMLALGASGGQIKRLLAARFLHPIHRGIYAVGHTNLTREGHWMAATLAGGDGAVLSHHTAAALHELIEHPRPPPHITVPTKGHRRPGIRIHAGPLQRDEVTSRDAIPTTTVPRTILDLAAHLDAFQLERVLAEAHFRGFRDERPLWRMTERYPRRRGLATLRRVLVGGNPRLGRTESPLEDRFLRFLDERRLERPELNRTLRIGSLNIRPDCLWRQHGVIVECDGRDAHQRRRTWERDRVRDRRLLASGLKPVRVTSEQLEHDPDELETDLRELGIGDRATGA
jgi:very-short-patch-repair endonuclease